MYDGWALLHDGIERHELCLRTGRDVRTTVADRAVAGRVSSSAEGQGGADGRSDGRVVSVAGHFGS